MGPKLNKYPYSYFHGSDPGKWVTIATPTLDNAITTAHGTVPLIQNKHMKSPPNVTPILSLVEKIK